MQLIESNPITSFEDLDLNPILVRTLKNQGIEKPFPIQAATIPDAISGHDILGRGQTGSGKTLAFGLSLLNAIFAMKSAPHRPLALVLAPTRELAQQINEVLHPLARSIGQDTVVIAGGMPYGKQVSALKRGVSILVATPGRLIDLLERNDVKLDSLVVTVLDEADQMADMGFLPAVKQILNQSKKDSQRMLFSATLDRGVDGLVRQYLRNPKQHSIKEIETSKGKMDHYVFVMKQQDKSSIAHQIASRDGKTIFFVRTQRGADRLTDNLAKVGVVAGALHGGKSQSVRTRTLARFKEEGSAVLVATDVAARGIHVDGIDLVVHYDAPADHKDYLHRSGRTARAGEVGRVVTLATQNEQRAMGGITMRAGVEAWVMAMTPMHQKLISITGAKEPSGIPVSQVAVNKVATASRPSPSRKLDKKNRNKRNRRKRFTAER